MENLQIWDKLVNSEQFNHVAGVLSYEFKDVTTQDELIEWLESALLRDCSSMRANVTSDELDGYWGYLEQYGRCKLMKLEVFEPMLED